MPQIQKQFEYFHKKILFDVDSSRELRERRDTILKNISEKISLDAPSYEIFTQGSYALYTGIIPLNGNPDFDIGIQFDCATSDYEDPLKLKKFVAEALKHQGRSVKIRRPCVTVDYFNSDKIVHHVDLAVYAKDIFGKMKIAWGRDSDAKENRTWETSRPKELIDIVINKYSGDEKSQFRRCVRALKRWRDYKIGHKNVPSIGLTIATYNTFSHQENVIDGKPIDILALIRITNSILDLWDEKRISVNLPVEPYNDLFESMTDVQMTDFKDKITSLRDALEDAHNHADTHEACKIMASQFGNDFPVPPKTETTKKSNSGVVPSGRSA